MRAPARTTAAPPIESTPAPRPTWKSPLVIAAVLSAGAAGGYFAIGKQTQPRVTPVAGNHVARHAGLSVELPDTGWNAVDRKITHAQGPYAARAEGFFRGGTLEEPQDMLFLYRYTEPGAFPREIDMAKFSQLMEMMERETSLFNNGGLVVSSLECEVEDIRQEATGQCQGDASMKGVEYRMLLYMWIATTDDLPMTMFVTRDTDALLDEARRITQSVEIQ
jgi:hypothetical protein